MPPSSRRSPRPSRCFSGKRRSRLRSAHPSNDIFVYTAPALKTRVNLFRCSPRHKNQKRKRFIGRGILYQRIVLKFFRCVFSMVLDAVLCFVQSNEVSIHKLDALVYPSLLHSKKGQVLGFRPRVGGQTLQPLPLAAIGAVATSIPPPNVPRERGLPAILPLAAWRGPKTGGAISMSASLREQEKQPPRDHLPSPRRCRHLPMLTTAPLSMSRDTTLVRPFAAGKCGPAKSVVLAYAASTHSPLRPRTGRTRFSRPLRSNSSGLPVAGRDGI